jgi:Rap1a immunity proteins
MAVRNCSMLPGVSGTLRRPPRGGRSPGRPSPERMTANLTGTNTGLCARRLISVTLSLEEATQRGIMKRHAIAIAAALALLGQPGTALAQSTQDIGSANAVMPGCRDAIGMNGIKNTFRSYLMATCAGIVRTIFYFGRSRLQICNPDGANVGQAIRLVVLYIDLRPARMNEQFEDLVLEALQRAWPCR